MIAYEKNDSVQCSVYYKKYISVAIYLQIIQKQYYKTNLFFYNNYITSEKI